MLSNLTVRSKLLTIVAAVVVLFGVSVLWLGMVAKHHVVSSVKTESERSNKIVNEFFASRYRQLDAGLNSLVDSPEIRAVLTTDGMDHDTQLMSIVDLQHLLDADAVLYCNEEGRTLARTDDPFDEGSIVSGLPLISTALKGEISRGFWDLNGKPLLAIAFPVTIEDEIKGVVCAGINVSADALAIKSLLLRDLVITRKGNVLTSSLGDDPNPRLADALSTDASTIECMSDVNRMPTTRLNGIESPEEADVLIANVLVSPTQSEQLKASVMIPTGSVFGFYQEFQNVLALVGSITIVASILITLKISSMISNQVQQTLNTLEQVASGDLSARLDINTKDEFGRISSALNTAIAASASTLDTLAVRNRDTNMLLDAVEQGFFTVNSDGVMSEERSGAIDRIFGPPASDMKFADFIAQFDSGAADWIEMGWEDVFMEIMPVEVTLDQLPKRFTHNDQTYSVEYTPVRVDDELTNVAIVLSDVTALVENEKLEAEQREMMAMVHRMGEDRTGFLEFFQESDDIIESLRSDSFADLSVTKRLVHTLKGNASIYGLMRVSASCHIIEDFIAENNELPESNCWTDMFSTWDSIKSNLAQITGGHQQGIEVSETDFDSLMENILSEASHSDLAVQMAGWRLEPTSLRLTRIEQQLCGLAKRLGKGDIQVHQHDHQLRLDAGKWSEFWSSFVHVVRNAVDHGLETPEQRIALGKPKFGSVELSTSVDGNQFVIAVHDDGKGIDWDRVTEAAYKKGLPAETHDDLVNALFADGLTTTEQVTDTSGRGVGMAAVKESCQRQGGSISVESQRGQGTTFQFRFPVTNMAPDTLEHLKKRKIAHPERALGTGTIEGLPHSQERQTV